MKNFFLAFTLSVFTLPATAYSNEMLWLERSIGFEDMAADFSLEDGAAKIEVKLWEDGIIPFVFDDKISAAQQQWLFGACEHWSRHAPVKCIQGPYKGRELKVTNDNGQGCWASIGTNTIYMFIKRRMNLADGCWTSDTLIHEVGHSFGLVHEHQRADRDKYVTINKNNVDGGFLGQNTKVNFDIQKTKHYSQYDFLSIMHYPRRAHSKDSLDTIVPKPQYMEFIDIMGNVTELSKGDITAIQTLYGKKKSIPRER